MAALDPRVDSDSEVSLMAHRMEHHQASKSDGKYFLLSTLSKKTGKLQQLLDFKFFSGEKIRLTLEGKGRVHLTGSLLPKQGKAKKPDLTKAELNRDFVKRLISIMKERKQIRKNAKNEARQKKKQCLQYLDDDTDSIDSVDKLKRDNQLLRLAVIRKRCSKSGAKKWQCDDDDSENEDNASGDEDQEMESSEENYDKESENDSNESDGEDEAQTEDEEEPPKKKKKSISLM
ncbi:Hypothetical predicted protein [Cloeon dipterum]|nr:Hypothetical predicted protein [Cloeon dipterum]